MIEIQMNHVPAKAHRPDIVVGLLCVQTDLVICAQKDDRKRILLEVIFAFIFYDPDLIVGIELPGRFQSFSRCFHPARSNDP